MDFSVITPTGDRPIPFAICCKLMEQQAVKPKEWIVIDDGSVNTDVPALPYIKYIMRKRVKGEPPHTLPVQMQAAIEHVTTKKVIIIEDDDWYSPQHLATMAGHLESHHLVGYTHNMYYFLQERKWHQHENDKWSSFCSTGFTKDCFNFFRHMPLHNPYIDLMLWRRPNLKKHLYRPEELMVLGIKQLPGREGITYSSSRTSLRRGVRNDNDLTMLKSIVGSDIKHYIKYCG